jgi:glucose/arabinose dehydrogenase
VDQEAESAYAIPPDNPFVDVAGAQPEVWHTGLRNPFRFRIDAESGDMWIGDVGQNAWEEVDLALGGIGGLDFGWNLVEGTHCFSADPCDDSDLTPPVVEYSHDLGCTVIGGDVWQPADEPASEGWYVFADNCSGTVFAVDVAEARSAAQDGSQVEPAVVLESGRRISAIARGPGGDLYATDLDGELLRFVAAAE